MFSTSTVRPPKVLMTSPGRIADPDGMFSAAPIRPVTRARTPSAGRADIAAITAAPPAMSDFICFIPSLGFRDSPPLSNVIPLPARTMCASALVRRIRQLDQAWRVRRTGPDGDDAAESGRGQLRLVPDPDGEAGTPRGGCRLVRQPPGGLHVRRHVDQVAGQGHGVRDHGGRPGTARIRDQQLDRTGTAASPAPSRIEKV